MITLILVVCLSSTPDVCREERPPIDPISPMACMMQGQMVAAEWLEEHPKYELHGWRCQFGHRDQA